VQAYHIGDTVWALGKIMAFGYEFDAPFVRMTSHGDTPFTVAMDVLLEMFASPDFPPRGKLIVDLRDSTQHRTPDEVRALVDVVGANHHQLYPYCAFVVGKPIHFGLSRMFAAMADRYPLKIGVFWEMEDALAWVHASDSGNQPDAAED